MAQTSDNGVPGFDEKIALCADLLGVTTPTEVVYAVFTRPKDRSLARRVAARIHRMRHNRPSNQDSRQFWDGLAAALGCDLDRVTGVDLMDASISEFIDCLPDDRQQRARGKLGRLRQAPYPSIDLAESRPVETIRIGLKNGRIDQKHYYLTPDAANAWFTLVRAEGYQSYDHCKTALQALVGSQEWKQSLASSHATSVVMLAGGGGPTKDLLMLRNMLAQPYLEGRPLDYYIVDISLYMLRESRLLIEEHGKTVVGIERSKVIAREGDVLNMTERDKEDFHQNGGAAVFTLTAGTIGNFSESAFFKSLNNVAVKGDLLILAADTIDGVPSAEVATALTDKYSHREFRQWIQPVVATVLSESGTHETVDGALDRVKVALRPGGEAAASNVQGSWSVVLTLEIGKKDVTLLTSTRYGSEQLIEFAAAFGWELVHNVSSPYNTHFRQFLFRRNVTESAGSRSVP